MIVKYISLEALSFSFSHEKVILDPSESVLWHRKERKRKENQETTAAPKESSATVTTIEIAPAGVVLCQKEHLPSH